MGDRIDLEIFHGGRWWRAGAVELRAGPVRQAPTWLAYDTDYASDHLFAHDRRAFSCRLPVDYDLHELPTFPPFVVDLLPQGEARRALEARLRDAGESTSDWSVLKHGAHSPVGNLRVAHPAPELVASEGFTREDVVVRGDTFREWAEREGIPMTGSSDTGGASPKLLLTEDAAGRWHADGALPDERAARHYLVKFARGRTRRDAQVLAHEPAYLELARGVGARCGAPLAHDRGALFVPRFDRIVEAGRVLRAGLESAYSLLGVVEPGARLAWEDVCASVAAVSSDPVPCVIELVRRDALSLALGDTDNHGRNTSLLKRPEGGVTLSPLYDFAPMFLDPDLVKRSTLWRSERPGDPPDWSDVAASLERWVDRGVLRMAMRDMGERIEALPDAMRALAVDAEILERCTPWIARVARGLKEVS